MKAEHLLRLADKLEGKGPYAKVGPVREDAFDMSVFADVLVNGQYTGGKDDNPTPDQCGFAACALGWAGSDPYFNALGLYMYKGTPRLEADAHGHERFGFDAARELFDITNMQAIDLFAEDDGNMTPAEVATNIRKFVKDYS